VFLARHAFSASLRTPRSLLALAAGGREPLRSAMTSRSPFCVDQMRRRRLWELTRSSTPFISGTAAPTSRAALVGGGGGGGGGGGLGAHCALVGLENLARTAARGGYARHPLRILPHTCPAVSLALDAIPERPLAK